MVNIPVSIGELFDKISILQIKRVMISDLEKVKHVKTEIIELMDVAKPYFQIEGIEDAFDVLSIVNKNLWDVEDAIRRSESQEKFDDDFIQNARSVYRLNDRRHEIKNKINILTNSQITEVKSYVEY